MLRISNLVRGRIPTKVPLRAGLPGWHRPDPPPSVNIPIDHELSDEEITFTFFDRNMPEFFLTQPEVYEGDTLMEAAPMLLKGLGYFAALSILMSSALYFTLPLRSDPVHNNEMEDRYSREKEMTENKQWLKWGRQNQIGIELSSESYPQFREGSTDIRADLKLIKAEMDAYTGVNREMKNYLGSVRERCESKVEEKLNAPQDHHDHHH